MRFEPVPAILRDMQVWAAIEAGYSFVITLELEPGADPEWAGYSASWKSLKADMRPFGRQPPNQIDGGPWRTRAAAEAACQATLEQLKRRV
jgi:hypothetical protein